jgi:hypothetical protein
MRDDTAISGMQGESIKQWLHRWQMGDPGGVITLHSEGRRDKADVFHCCRGCHTWKGRHPESLRKSITKYLVSQIVYSVYELAALS